MLDSVICDVGTRFSAQTLSSCELTCLLPKNILNLNAESLESTVNSCFTSSGDLAEIRLWKEKWLRSSENTSVVIPVSLEEASQNCDEDPYSLLNSLLTILLMLLVSVALAERSFSSLRRLKPWLKIKWVTKG